MLHKSLLTRFAEAIDEHRAAKQAEFESHAQPSQVNRISNILRWLLPTPGNILFTLLVIGGLLWAQSVGAISFGAPLAASTSTGTLAYQGRLANSNGQPLTQTVNMIFRLYAAASGGTPLWEEQWTGSSSVQVSDGLFNVMLGSLTPIPQAVITGNSNLFLGITVGTDSEMSPRVQLGSVPFATQALTVPDGSITTAKLADGAVTVAKLGNASIPHLLGKKICNDCGVVNESVSGGLYTAKGANAQDPIEVTVTTSGVPIFVQSTLAVRPSTSNTSVWCIVDIYQGNSLVRRINLNGARATIASFGCSGGYLLDDLSAGTYTFKSILAIESSATLSWSLEREIVVFEY